MFGDQIAAIFKHGYAGGETINKLFGTDVPIVLQGVTISREFLEMDGIRLCSRGEVGKDDMVDSYDGLEITLSGTPVRLKFSSDKISAVVIEKSGSEYKLNIQCVPSGPGEVAECLEYRLNSIDCRFARGYYDINGVVTLSSDLNRIGATAPSIRLIVPSPGR
jgi:hypothetical protein